MSLDEKWVKEVYNVPGRYGGWSFRDITRVPTFVVRQLLYQARIKYLDREMLADPALKPGASVLMLCCANGKELEMLVDRIGKDARVLAIDFAPHLLEEARQRANALGMTNVELREANASHDLKLDTQFDVVTCAGGISVIPNWPGAYENIVKYVRVGGTIFVWDVLFRDGWRKVFNPLLTWSTKEFGGTNQGMGQFTQFVEKLRKDPNLTDVSLSLRGYSGLARAVRKS